MKLILIGLIFSLTTFALNVEFKCLSKNRYQSYFIGSAKVDNSKECKVTSAAASGYFFSISDGISFTRIFNESQMAGRCAFSKTVEHLILTSNPTTGTTLQLSIPSNISVPPVPLMQKSLPTSGTLVMIENGTTHFTGCDYPEIKTTLEEDERE